MDLSQDKLLLDLIEINQHHSILHINFNHIYPDDEHRESKKQWRLALNTYIYLRLIHTEHISTSPIGPIS
jgi:hypothetical protein